MTSMKLITLAAAGAALLAPTFLTSPAQAGILHKHPVAAGAAAGLAAHHMAKKGAASRAAHGKKPNLAERHPVLSGLAAGGVAHHMLKK
jgi:hypothetical protein